MDPYDSPIRSPYSSRNNPFPHSLLRTRQMSLRCKLATVSSRKDTSAGGDGKLTSYVDVKASVDDGVHRVRAQRCVCVCPLACMYACMSVCVCASPACLALICLFVLLAVFHVRVRVRECSQPVQRYIHKAMQSRTIAREL